MNNGTSLYNLHFKDAKVMLQRMRREGEVLGPSI